MAAKPHPKLPSARTTIQAGSLKATSIKKPTHTNTISSAETRDAGITVKRNECINKPTTAAFMPDSPARIFFLPLSADQNQSAGGTRRNVGKYIHNKQTTPRVGAYQRLPLSNAKRVPK